MDANGDGDGCEEDVSRPSAAPEGAWTGPSGPTGHPDDGTHDHTNTRVSTSYLNDDHDNEDEQNTRESAALWESTDRGRPKVSGSLAFNNQPEHNEQIILHAKDNTPSDGEAVDVEDMDRELQEAMDETYRLDAVLATLQLKVKLLKLQGKELRKQLWEELMSIPKSVEYPGEAENTRLFLALEAPLELEVEADFEPLFETQPPDENGLGIGHKEEQSQNNAMCSTKSCEEDQQEKAQEPPHHSHSDTAHAKKQQNFVKKNFELAGATGDLVLMTAAEKDRLVELLRDVDEEYGQEDGHTDGEGSDSEGDAWAVSLCPGEGFTPDAAQLEMLRYIDFRLNLLSAVEDSLSVQSSVDGSISLGPGSDADWELGEEASTNSEGDAGYETEGAADLASATDAPAAQDAGLVVSQVMASLSEEQLRGLLDECELSQITCPEPPLSEALLTALLRDPYASSYTHLGPDAQDT